MRVTSINPTSAAAEQRPRASAGSFIDPHTLMRIKSLQLRARIVVQGFLSGLHRSPHHGFSVEFSEYRQYSPGDDPRYLDWRLYARSDRYYIKRFQEETNVRCHLLVDLSRSMGYGSAVEYTKVEYARTAAATLAYFLSMQRDAVGLVTFDQQIADYVPARYRPGHLHRLMVCLERAVAGTSTDVSAPLEQIAATVRKRGMVVLISDLLTQTQALAERLGYLRSQGHEVVLLRVLDPAELDFGFDRPATFVDMETGKDLYIDPSAARARYRENFARHEAEIRRACSDLGISFHQLPTSQPLELALFDFLQSRMHGGRQVVRARGRSHAHGA
ncbi:MAG TPA: DUF58 domain-containing protein [Tepidisphaeraceae bacterium]|jgi:uncharacterized protein (DUF58 family)